MSLPDNLDDVMNARMNPNNLYTEEVVTDREIGKIRVLTPILDTGARDTTRPMLFIGETQLLTQMGPLPLSFEIPAQTVAEAVKNYGAAAKEGLRKTLDRLEELRREQQNQILTPGMPGYQAPPSNNPGGIIT